MEIKSEVRGGHSSQLDQTLYIEQDGKRIAHLDFSTYRGEPHVQMLYVDPDHRRNGLGAALMRELQRLHPSEEINLGTLTRDGSALIDSLKFATVTDPRLDKLARLQSRIKDKLAHLEQLPDTEIMANIDVWNRLRDMETSLDDQLWGQKVERRFIETTIMERFLETPIYHAMSLEHSKTALTNNELLATSTQRFWGDGRRRKENAPDYRDSYWMKGISLTRDIRYALKWNAVTFVLNQSRIKSKVKVIPFAWNYHFDPKSVANPDHKREREEFVIVKGNRDDYQRSEEDGGGMDTNRFVAPEGALKPLSQFLMGILLSKQVADHYAPEDVAFITQHPRFLGWA